jgi:hypothetical protein
MAGGLAKYASWDTRCDRACRDVLGDDSTRTNYRVVTDPDASRNNDFRAQPDISPDNHRSRCVALLSIWERWVSYHMVAVAYGDHFRDQAVVADADRLLGADRAVMSEDRAGANDQLAATLDGEVPVKHAAFTEDDLTASESNDRETASYVAAWAELNAKPACAREHECELSS